MILIANVFMFLVLYLVNRDYATVEHYQYGYEMTDFTITDGLFLILLIAIGTFSIPRRIDRPSTLFLVISYWFIVVPFQVLGLTGANSESPDRYIVLLTVHMGYFCCAILNRNGIRRGPSRHAHPSLLPMLITLWVLTTIALFVIFGGIMRISALDLIYEQRSLGRASNFLEGYLQTYNQYVFSTALVAFGCYRRNYILIAAGFGGAIMNYSITAEKSSVAFPFFIVALYYMMRSKSEYLRSSSFVAFALSLMCVVGLALKSFLTLGQFLIWYVGVRTLLTPGQQIILYSDYFTTKGFTYFSHVRGLNLFIPTPAVYSTEVRWPSLGHIVGELHLNIPNLNSNANFIASDGVASMGAFGVLVVFLLIAILLYAMDRVAKGIDPVLMLPVLLPISLTLTNGSIFTVITSFGGLFWAIIFLMMFKKSN